MCSRILDIPSSGGRALYPTPPYLSALALELDSKPPEALSHAEGRSNNVLRTQSLGEMVPRPDIRKIRAVYPRANPSQRMSDAGGRSNSHLMQEQNRRQHSCSTLRDH